MKSKLGLELLWWVFTAVLVVLVLLPVYRDLGNEYPFYVDNIALIIIFVTLARYIFLLKHTWLARMKWVKVVLVFLPIPLFFYMTDALYNFQDFLDKDGFVLMLMDRLPDEALEIVRYIKSQYLFFGTAAMIVLFMFPLRLIISVWRGQNRGTV